MDSLNELKTIWRTANTDSLPSHREMLRLIKNFRDDKLRSKVLLITAAFLLMMLLVIDWLFNRPRLVSTTIGMMMALCAMLILAVSNIRSLGRFIRFNDCSNREFILFLEQTRRNQLFYHQKTQVAGMLFASGGLVLYLYEFVRHNLMLTMLFYALALAYLAFIWLYLRPVKFKKQTVKLNQMIERLHQLSDQIE
jgi:hypothetical protein